MSLFMNRWQEAVCETYSGGEYRYLTRSPLWRERLDGLGDTLFSFLMIELSDAEDCADTETALQRLDNARSDLDRAIEQIMRLAPRH